jgi:hypothetical protein
MKIDLEGYNHLKDRIRSNTILIDQVLDEESPELHKRLSDSIKDMYQIIEDMNDENTWDIRDTHDDFGD